MDPIIVGLIGLFVFFVFLLIGMPIGTGMAIIGFVGVSYLTTLDAGFVKLGLSPFDTAMSYGLSVVPLFLFMAFITFYSGISEKMFNIARKWMGHQPGGMAMACVAACAGFAALSSSSVATAATMGLVALPEMKKLKYAPSLTAGSLAAGGTMGVLIPPSTGFIIIGILTGTSIGKLFIAGIIPGLLEATCYIMAIYLSCRLNPLLGPRGPAVSFIEKLATLKSCGDLILLIVLMLGGLMIGWFTPNEAGAIGAFGAIMISVVRKQLSWAGFKKAILDTLRTSGMVYWMIIGAMLMQYFLAATGLPGWLEILVESFTFPGITIILVMMLIYIILGCFLDVMAMVVITCPIFFPIIINLGFSPIWFGVLVVRITEIAMITPPVGLNIFVLQGISHFPTSTIIKGLIPFIIADLICLILLVLFPSLSLFLPGLMK